MENRKGLQKRYILLAIILVPVVLYWLFANAIIKSFLEKQLSQSHGAEVNIGSLDHGLFPAKIMLSDIQMTDPAKPTHNKVTVVEAKADVDVMALLSNQVLVDELSIVDIAFDQVRQSEGFALVQPESKFNFNQWLEQQSESAPSVDDVLAKSPLKTTAAIADAKATYDKYGSGLKDDYDALPNKDKMAYYKQEVESLKNTDYKNPQALLEAKEKLSKLKEEMLADKENIAAFSEKAKSASAELSQSVEALKTAPAQDYDLLKGLVAGDQQAIETVTLSVFGEQAAAYTQYITAAVQMVGPMLGGESVESTPDDSAKDPMQLLIRKANVSLNWQGERVESKWENITNAHTIFGNPTTFMFKGAGEKLANFTSNGQLWIDESGLDAEQTWELLGAGLENLALSDTDRFSATISSALLNTLGNVKVVDNQLSGSSEIDLTSLAMQAAGNDKLTSIIADTLSGLSELDMVVDLDGTITAPGFKLSSDLDSKIAQAAVGQLGQEQQAKLNELQQKLNGMASEQLGANGSQLADINGLIGAANSDSGQLDELLNAQLTNLVEQQKDKLLKKLFN